MCWLKYLTGVCLIAACISCSTSGKLSSEQTIFETVNSKLGDSTELIWNNIKTMAIAKRQVNHETFSSLKYIVISADGSILKEGTIKPGYIKWLNDHTIEYLDMPGIIRENENLDSYKKTIIFN